MTAAGVDGGPCRRLGVPLAVLAPLVLLHLWLAANAGPGGFLSDDSLYLLMADWFAGSREPVVVRQVAADPVEYPERRLFGNLTGSEAVEVGSQILASLQPLPVAPVATGRLEVDVENLTLYHAAVALHFKRDEQLRTIGSLLAKLMS